MISRKLGLLVLAGSLSLSFVTHADAKKRLNKSFVTSEASARSGSHGLASYYTHTGRRTANGERANPAGLTAAHKTLPFGTMVRVTNTRTNRSVVVRINDRGPFVRGRVIDLTPTGARAIGMGGLAPVSLSVVGRS